MSMKLNRKFGVQQGVPPPPKPAMQLVVNNDENEYPKHLSLPLKREVISLSCLAMELELAKEHSMEETDGGVITHSIISHTGVKAILIQPGPVDYAIKIWCKAWRGKSKTRG